MTRAVRSRFLAGLIGAIFALSTLLAVFAHRMPTQSDLALARFVAMGGTANDLCNTNGHRDLLQELSNLCAPDLAPALTAPGQWLPLGARRVVQVRWPRAVPVGADGTFLFRPAIRAPPSRA